MAAFYLDENVRVELAIDLRRLGHNATTTADERRLGASDAHQLLYAAQRNWILLTHNRHDFYLLHTAWLLWCNDWRVPNRHAGILIIEQARPVAVDDFARLIDSFVDQSANRLLNTLHDWRLTRGWVPYQQ